MKTNSDQCNGSSLFNQVKIAFLAKGWSDLSFLDPTFIVRALARVVAKIYEMEVFVVVPQIIALKETRKKLRDEGLTSWKQ